MQLEDLLVECLAPPADNDHIHQPVHPQQRRRPEILLLAGPEWPAQREDAVGQAGHHCGSALDRRAGQRWVKLPSKLHPSRQSRPDSNAVRELSHGRVEHEAEDQLLVGLCGRRSEEGP